MQTLTQIGKDIESSDNAKPRMHEAFGVGDESAQGDILITRIAAVPKGVVEVEDANPQLAPGENRGARHVLRTMEGVRVFRVPGNDPLIGPIVELADENWIDHPEHAAQGFPAGCYAITYQRTIVDGVIQRVQD